MLVWVFSNEKIEGFLFIYIYFGLGYLAHTSIEWLN